MNPPEGLAPKRPPGWAKWEALGLIGSADWGRVHVWSRGRMLVLSSVVQVLHNGEQRWHWMVSASVKAATGKRRRPSDEELGRVLKDFGMATAEEEKSPEPGVARKMFLPCEAQV